MKKNVTWCDRSMFQGPYYGLVTTPKLFKKELRKMGVDDSLEFTSGNSNATCYEFESNGKTSFLVTIKGWKDQGPIEVAALIVHEATHIKQHVMRIIGEKNPSAEFEAYMMQNIYANLMTRFMEQTK